jgi:hypothetical protein
LLPLLERNSDLKSIHISRARTRTTSPAAGMACVAKKARGVEEEMAAIERRSRASKVEHGTHPKAEIVMGASFLKSAVDGP